MVDGSLSVCIQRIPIVQTMRGYLGRQSYFLVAMPCLSLSILRSFETFGSTNEEKILYPVRILLSYLGRSAWNQLPIDICDE